MFSLKMVAPLATKIVIPDFESFELKNSEVLEVFFVPLWLGCQSTSDIQSP